MNVIEKGRQYPTLVAGMDIMQVPSAAMARERTPIQSAINPTSMASGHKMSDISRDEINAKIEASEARTETKLAQVESRIDLMASQLSSKIDSLKEAIVTADGYNRDTRLVILATVITSTFAIIAIVVGMATYGDALFGRGMDVRDVVHSVIREQQMIAAPLSRSNHP